MEMEIEKLEIFKAPDKNDFLDIIEWLKNSHHKYRTNINLEDLSK